MATFFDKTRILIALCLLLSAIHLLNVLSNYQLLIFGVFPRQVESLPFIMTLPFLHGSAVHLVNNMVGLCIFGGLILLRSKRLFVRSSLFIVVLSGLLVWLFGRPAIHIGASGWVFGLWSLSIALAFYRRRVIDLIIACFVIIFYGGMAYGVLPGDPLVSFESHLFGALAGILYVAMPGQRARRLA
ncbi:MAG: rhomboid family intramembrane serine protease [Cellvibrionaceae bacterium]